MKNAKWLGLFLTAFLIFAVRVNAEVTKNYKKWNPGHYILVRTDNPEGIQEILSNPANYIRGVQIEVKWSKLETAKDVYDFSFIEQVLELLKKNNKQLFLQVGDRTFHPGKQRPVPDYLYEDPQYHGGVEPKIQGGEIAKIWDPAVNERFNLLIQKLGERFDNDPNFEGINFDESFVGINLRKAKRYSHKALVEGMISRIDNAVKYFPHSVVIQYMNWGPSELKQVIEHLENSGAGMGGPDLVPDQGRFDYLKRIPVYEDYRKYAGKIPLGTAVQSENLVSPEWYFDFCAKNPGSMLCAKDKQGNYLKRKGDFTLDGFWDMGINTLKLNYIFWQSVEGGRYKFQFKEDILPYINSKKGQINKERPTVRCNPLF